jgi:glutamate-1-semialdehyde 2,1-aminomutase
MAPPITKFDRAHELQRRLHDLIPGGGHTYSRGEDQFPYNSPQVLVRASGAYCWDVDGNRFLDWAMGNRVYVLGHAYPAVDQAVRRQIELGVNFTRPCLLEYELAEYLVDLLPCAEMVKFGKNGSDVTSAAVRLARAYTGRKYVAYCVQQPFFSAHDWFIGATVMNSGVPREIAELTVSFPYNDVAGVEEVLGRYRGEIAALILEPVKNDEPRDGYLDALRKITEREGIVLIFDEMISGVRFDLRGAHHRYGVCPDLATFGKAIANGYSFSLLAGKRELMQLGGLHHEYERVFLLSQTHGAELTGLAACKATLEECEGVDVTEHIWTLGQKLVQGIRGIAKTVGVSSHIRVVGFDCNPQILCTSADGAYWPALHTSFHEELIARGVLIPWTTITWSHGDDELEQTFEAFFHAAEKVARVLAGESVEESFAGEAVKPVFRSFNRCAQSRCGRVDASAPRLDCCEASETSASG